MNTLQSPELSQHRRKIAILALAGSTVLAACGSGASASDNIANTPVSTIDVSPIETPNTQAPEKTTTSEAVDAPVTTKEQDTVSDMDLETQVANSYDEYGFPKKYIHIPTDAPDGEIFMRMYNNIAACVNHCDDNLDLIKEFGLRDGLDDSVLESLTVTTPEYYKTLFGNGSSEVLARISYQTPEDANLVVKTILDGVTIDGNQVYRLELPRDAFYGMYVQAQNGLDAPFQKDGAYLSDYWFGHILFYIDPETQEVKLAGFGHEQSD